MNNLPLHAGLVHLPIGIALVLPVIAIGVAWAVWTGRLARGAWWIVVVMQVVLVAGGFAALRTGESEEERIEDAVAESAIETHEERAQLFWWTSLVVLGIGTVGVVVKPGARRIVHASLGATVAGTVLVAGLAVAVGHAGGTLVYTHDAPAARAGAAPFGGQTGPSTLGPARDERDDDEEH